MLSKLSAHFLAREAGSSRANSAANSSLARVHVYYSAAQCAAASASRALRVILCIRCASIRNVHNNITEFAFAQATLVIIMAAVRALIHADGRTRVRPGRRITLGSDIVGTAMQLSEIRLPAGCTFAFCQRRPKFAIASEPVRGD